MPQVCFRDDRHGRHFYLSHQVKHTAFSRDASVLSDVLISSYCNWCQSPCYIVKSSKHKIAMLVVGRYSYAFIWKLIKVLSMTKDAWPYLFFLFLFFPQHQDAAFLTWPEHSHPWGDWRGDCRPDQGKNCTLLMAILNKGLLWENLFVSQAHVQALEGLLVEDQVLLLAGCPLENDASLVSCGVSEHCTLEVAGRLLGGMCAWHVAIHIFECLFSSGLQNLAHRGWH